MIVILLLIGLPALVGVIACRLTRVYPLTIGLAMAVAGGLTIFMVLAGIIGVDAIRIAPLIALLPGAAGTLGGFLGWLGRKHMERMDG